MNVKLISECFIKPSNFQQERTKQVLHRTPWDLCLLTGHYIQKGLLFRKISVLDDEASSIQGFLQRLKHSLSVTLAHFYPLAGRLATQTCDDPHSYVVYIDCSHSPGAKFVHSKVDLTVSDILSPTYVPSVVQHFFDHYKAVNHDGHSLSLLTVQVTELIDGIFIGFSSNHCVADGTSFWQFINTLSEVFRENIGNEAIQISSPPVHGCWFPDGYGPFYSLPFTHHDQFINRYQVPELKERIFHFSVAALARIKAKANALCKDRGITVSTLQALSALMWRCVIRGRGLEQNHTSICRTSVNIRSRLEPPLPHNYFGNGIQTVAAVTTAGELLEHDLGWAAAQLTEAIAKHDDKAVREALLKWLQNPIIHQIEHLVKPGLVMFGSSPRFNMYGNEFGLGKAVAVLSGHDNKFDGKGTLYPGKEGGGSIDVDLCLIPHSMSALERDEEFLDALNFHSDQTM
ncbi:putative Anthranilate N-benzoyltransferase protein [Heracleum sosnowskyi]|uniref:Anthranilate N-benzoyltransferase protein n=1 Tax=Heracleum sosnowskyi TaxID=360622 RepID=A0AAD8J541_9APIA|nr:putative Anthranilate N-benzoyltransferase protein [Heracleum sosnowskyi]